jgi:hypothetical protein
MADVMIWCEALILAVGWVGDEGTWTEVLGGHGTRKRGKPGARDSPGDIYIVKTRRAKAY